MMTGGSRKAPPEPLSTIPGSSTPSTGVTQSESTSAKLDNRALLSSSDVGSSSSILGGDNNNINNNSQFNTSTSTSTGAGDNETNTAKHSLSDASNLPQFRSALEYADVKDFAYPNFHPLHYGVALSSRDSEYSSYLSLEEEEENNPSSKISNTASKFADGPPWQEDADLNSPIITNEDNNREYEFSVASADEIHGKAIALFEFVPENDNEVPLREGQVIWVSYRHGQGWLVAENPETGETGLVPEEYVQLLSATDTSAFEEDHDQEEAEIYASPEADSEGWVDEDTKTVNKHLDNMSLDS